VDLTVSLPFFSSLNLLSLLEVAALPGYRWIWGCKPKLGRDVKCMHLVDQGWFWFFWMEKKALSWDAEDQGWGNGSSVGCGIHLSLLKKVLE